MLRRALRLLLPRSALFTQPLQYRFTAGRTSRDLMLKYVTDSIAGQQRREFLQQQIINKAKIVVVASIRKPQETVIGLKKQGKCVGVIRGHDGEEDIDVVMPGGQFKGLMRRLKASHGTVCVRVEGQDILCAIQDIKLHAEMWIYRVYLQKLVFGKPTEVTVPIILANTTSSASVQNGSTMLQKHSKVSLVTYNQDYPTLVSIDVTYVTPERPYRFADLANTFPPGLELSPKHKPMDKILVLNVASNIEVSEILENYEIMKEKMAAEKEAAKKAAAAKGAAAAKPGDAGKGAAPAKSGGKK